MSGKITEGIVFLLCLVYEVKWKYFNSGFYVGVVKVVVVASAFISRVVVVQDSNLPEV